MRLTCRREPDLFEKPQNLGEVRPERRQAIVEMLGTLLTEALAPQLAPPTAKEARHEPHRG